MLAREALQRNVDTFRRDILSALADEAEESGEADLAAGYRWLRDKCRWLIRTRADGGAAGYGEVCWAWYTESPRNWGEHSYCDQLPHEGDWTQCSVFDHRRGRPGAFRSESAALEAAARHYGPLALAERV